MLVVCCEASMRTAGSAVLTMMKIGTIAESISARGISARALGWPLRRNVAIEWIMTANTAAATNAQAHRIGVGTIMGVRAPGDARPDVEPAVRTTAGV